MEVADLVPIGDARNFVDRAVVPGLHFIRIFDDFIDEVTEMQDEIEPALRRRALIFEDHAAIGVELAFIDALAAYEGEVNRAWIVRPRRGDGPADAAAVALRVGEAIPVNAGRLEPSGEHPTRPVRRCRNYRRGVGDDAVKAFVLRDLDRQRMPGALIEGPPGPQDDAVGSRIS